MERHVSQLRHSYCVPACIVMVERWRGASSVDTDRRQEQLFSKFASNGLCSLRALDGRVGQWRYFSVDDPDSSELLAAEVSDDRWAIVECMSGPFGAALRRLEARSPHGELSPGPLPYHAICLVGRTGRGFEFLDPWSAREHQPLTISIEDFATFWTGGALFVQRVPIHG